MLTLLLQKNNLRSNASAIVDVAKLSLYWLNKDHTFEVALDGLYWRWSKTVILIIDVPVVDD